MLLRQTGLLSSLGLQAGAVCGTRLSGTQTMQHAMNSSGTHTQIQGLRPGMKRTRGMLSRMLHFQELCASMPNRNKASKTRKSNRTKISMEPLALPFDSRFLLSHCSFSMRSNRLVQTFRVPFPRAFMLWKHIRRTIANVSRACSG